MIQDESVSDNGTKNYVIYPSDYQEEPHPVIENNIYSGFGHCSKLNGHCFTIHILSETTKIPE